MKKDPTMRIIFLLFMGGGGGIRTHGTPKSQGLANPWNRPLSDASTVSSIITDLSHFAL